MKTKHFFLHEIEKQKTVFFITKSKAAVCEKHISMLTPEVARELYRDLSIVFTKGASTAMENLLEKGFDK